VREFRDLGGVRWSVFRATPQTSPSRRERILPASYRMGWLVFECETERRRFAPVPENWEVLTERELERLCTLADVVPTRAPQQRRAADLSELALAPTPVPPRDANDSASSPPVESARLQELLAQVMEEVCDQPPVQSLNTEELIRVQQTLAIAANAASEAVAQRRAAH